MESDVRLIGDTEIASALDRASDLYIPFASKAVAISLTAIYSKVSPYPPQPARNRAKSFNTYVRGQGTYPKSAFVPDVSEIGGFRTIKTRHAQIRMTSQQMDKRFKQSVHVSSDAVVGELKNTATYSGHVIGRKSGDPKQASFHALTGWANTEDSLEAAMPAIDAAFNDSVDSFLEALSKGQ